LTTAASLWCTAAVGLACVFGMYAVAVFAALLVVFTLMVLNRLDDHIPSRASRTVVIMLPPGDTDSVERLRGIMKNKRMTIRDVDYNRNFQTNVETISVSVSIPLGVDAALLRSIADEIPELTYLAIR